MELKRGIPVIIILNGVNTTAFTKGFEKPFDHLFMQAMDTTATLLCNSKPAGKCACTYSDKIILFLDELCDDNEIQKVCSTTASLATLIFNKVFDKAYLDNLAEFGEADAAHDRARRKGLTFDAYCFNIAENKLSEYFEHTRQVAAHNNLELVMKAFFNANEFKEQPDNDRIGMLNQHGIHYERTYSKIERLGRFSFRNRGKEWT